MVKQGLGIRLREYKQGRISLTADIKFLNDIKRWAISHASENNDKAAQEFIVVHDKYLRVEKDAMAHMIFKDIKSHKRKHKLTPRENEIIKGTKYHYWLKGQGW